MWIQSFPKGKACKGVGTMENLFESVMDLWGNRAAEFLLFLWGVGAYKLPGSGNEPFGMQ